MNCDRIWKKKKENIRHYNTIVDLYSLQYRDEQVRKYKAVLKLLCISKGDFILDVGCGTGLFVEEVADSGACVIGVDSSKNMIQKAKHDYGDQQVFLCADADHMPFVERIFDSVFSFSLLQNMPNPKKTMMEIYRVTKTGSKIVFSAPKKTLTKSSFLRLLNENLVLFHFICEEELKDYVAICSVR